MVIAYYKAPTVTKAIAAAAESRLTLSTATMEDMKRVYDLNQRAEKSDPIELIRWLCPKCGQETGWRGGGRNIGHCRFCGWRQFHMIELKSLRVLSKVSSDAFESGLRDCSLRLPKEVK